MPITFMNDSDILVYGLEKIIAFARRSGYIFSALCIWWLASIIGLEQGLIIHIDNLHKRAEALVEEPVEASPENLAVSSAEQDRIHPSRVHQVPVCREVSITPKDLTEDRWANPLLKSAEHFIEESTRARNTSQRNRVNLLPQTKNQLKKRWNIKRLLEAKKPHGNKGFRKYELRFFRTLAWNRIYGHVL
jgi:hypothetical protein